MKAPVERKLYPKGYYECSLCGHGVETWGYAIIQET
jgi:hypothetical protein